MTSSNCTNHFNKNHLQPSIQHHSLAHLQNYMSFFWSNSSSLLDALIDFKSVLDTFLLLQLLWYSWKPVGETSLTLHSIWQTQMHYPDTLEGMLLKKTFGFTTRIFKCAKKIRFHKRIIPIYFFFFTIWVLFSAGLSNVFG